MKFALSLLFTIVLSISSFAQNGVYLYGFMENAPDFSVQVDVQIITNSGAPASAMMFVSPGGDIPIIWVELPDSAEIYYFETGFFDCDGQYLIETFPAEFFENLVDVPFFLSYCSNPTDTIYGCTDSNAINYNPDAYYDDGSCIYETTCTDVFIQFDGTSFQQATWSLWSDEGFQMTDIFPGSNYSLDACLPDGCYQLEIFSEVDSSEIYFSVFIGDSLVTSNVFYSGESISFGVGEDCGSTPIYGCTDPEAINYNPNATIDNGSCFYDTVCELNDIDVLISTQSWGYEISWAILKDGVSVAYGNNYQSDLYYDSNWCLEDGCYTFEMYDSYGDGWNGGTFEVYNNGNLLASGSLTTGYEGVIPFGINEDGCVPEIFGCTDPVALNYNPNATADDGSCTYFSYAENDLCSDAIPLQNGTNIVDNTNALQNENIWGECWGFGQGEGEQSSVWYTFTTPDVPASIHIEAIYDGSNTLTDTQFGVFETCGGEMIYCDGNGGQGLMSRLDFECGQLAVNTTYLLMIDGWGGDAGTCYLDFIVDTPCVDPVLGCTDPQAINYNPLATQNDGSCVYSTECTEVMIQLDGTSNFEYDWILTSTDGYFNAGFYPGSDFIINDCLEDGCYDLFFGSNDTLYEVYYSVFIENQMVAGGILSANQTGSFSVGAGCDSTEVLYGCTDPLALNYNPDANTDDGSCEYNTTCDFNEITVQINTQSWGQEIYWVILNSDSEAVAQGNGYESQSVNTSLWCLPNGCYTFEMYDTYGDGWNGGSYEVSLDGNNISTGFLENGYYDAISFGVNQEGCVDTTPIYGCTDPQAFNYNPNASEDDGSCIYQFDCSIDFLVVPDSTGEETIWIIPTENILGAVEVLWDFGDGTTSNELFPSHQYEGDGPFTLCVTATFASQDGSTCSITYCVEISGNMVGGPGFGAGSGFTINVINGSIALGIEETDLLSDLALWPNPTSNLLNIEYNNLSSKEQTIDIIDVTGKIAVQKQFGAAFGIVNKSIDLQDLPSGIYVLRLSTSDFSQSKRFVIAK